MTLKWVLSLLILINVFPVRAVTIYYTGPDGNGRNIEVDVPVSTNVLQLKQIISQRIQVPADRFSVLFVGTILADTQQLSDYNIQSEDPLTLHQIQSDDNTSSQHNNNNNNNPNGDNNDPKDPERPGTYKWVPKDTKSKRIKPKCRISKSRKRRLRRKRRKRKMNWLNFRNYWGGVFERDYLRKLGDIKQDKFAKYITTGRINDVDLTHKDFNDLFDVFNHLLFDGILENVTFNWLNEVGPPHYPYAAGAYYPYSNAIYLSLGILRHPSVSNINRIEIMLHEMVHAFLHLNNVEDGHGIYFELIVNVINNVLGLNITIYHSYLAAAWAVYFAKISLFYTH